MARAPRDSGPGIFHVTVKALGPGPYFLDVVDRVAWRVILARTIIRMRGSFVCISYCQMTTHAHAIFEVDERCLSRGMHILNGEYTRAMNRAHGRKGPLQTRRFHAVRIRTAKQLASTFRYDARNPVRAGICGSPLGWPYSSYAAAVGLEDDGGLTDTSRVLDHFGRDRDGAVAALRVFVELSETRAA